MSDQRYLKLFNELKEDPTKKDALLDKIEESPNEPIFTDASGRVYKPKSKEARVELYRRNKALRAKILENRIPFICPEFDTDFCLSQGLTLVAAMSGQSKSTTSANIVAGFIKHTKDKRVTIVTNEEGPDAVIDRIACVLHGQNYNDLYKGRMPERYRREVEDTAVKLAERVEVIDDPAWDMTCLEDVKSVIDSSVTNGTNMVVVDYLQTVTHSREYPHIEAYQVSKKLGLFFKDFGRRAPVPVVVFAQLSPQKERAMVQDRIQNDKTIYNHAFNVIEVKPNFETLVTEFVIHKGRFELQQGKRIVMRFDKGRYVPSDEV